MRDEWGGLTADDGDAFTVRAAREGAARPPLEWTTARAVRGEHGAWLAITAAGRYAVSVARRGAAGPVHQLQFLAQRAGEVTVEVMPPPPPPLPLVLSGHAASLTLYSLDTPMCR